MVRRVWSTALHQAEFRIYFVVDCNSILFLQTSSTLSQSLSTLHIDVPAHLVIIPSKLVCQPSSFLLFCILRSRDT